MRKFKLALCALAMLFAALSAASAQAQLEPSCGTFLAYPQGSAMWQTFSTWHAGFLDGLNFALNRDIFLGGAGMGWITDYCRSNPQVPFKTAAMVYAMTVIAATAPNQQATGR